MDGWMEKRVGNYSFTVLNLIDSDSNKRKILVYGKQLGVPTY